MNVSVEKARDWLRQLFVWDHAEKQQIARAGQALGYGLDPDKFVRPFPGSPSNTTVNIAPAQRGGGLGKVLGVVALLGTFGLAGTLGMAVLDKLKSGEQNRSPAPVQPKAVEQQPHEWEVRWKLGPDGKWQTEVVPVKP